MIKWLDKNWSYDFFYLDASYSSWRWRRGTNSKKRDRDIYCGNELMPALTRGPGCKLSHCERRAVLIKMVLMAIVHLSLHIRHQKSKLRVISLWVRTGPNLDWIKVQFLAVLNCGSQDVFCERDGDEVQLRFHIHWNLGDCCEIKEVTTPSY